jgi:hypothetical protein
MKRLLLILLFAACQQHETTVTTTASEPATVETTASQTAPAATIPAEPSLPKVEGPKLRPVDESSKDPSFAAYRGRLAAAVERKDADALLALVDPKIRTSFGEGGGTGDLRKTWNLDQGAASPLWNELATMLSMGGSFSEVAGRKRFCMPYVYSVWPEEHDAFMSFAVIGENVPLVDKDGKPIALLAHDVVTYMPEPSQSPEEFQTAKQRRVKTADGREGYISTQNLRSPIDWRACFAQTAGDWKMDLLVKGD